MPESIGHLALVSLRTMGKYNTELAKFIEKLKNCSPHRVLEAWAKVAHSVESLRRPDLGGDVM